ncbi:MAG: hypothetical protein ACI8U3_001527 [Brevundimonas sp.]|jgi:hypothetical protein|uniref:hypothetical protein n=1 Tax=Brevundimonas sp. TaxID=1871086 RepID=UPI0039E2982C
MSLTVTLAALAAAIGLTVFSGWRGSRPPDLIRGPRMAPWRFFMLLGITVGIFLVVHLVNLAGFDTSAARPGF